MTLRPSQAERQSPSNPAQTPVQTPAAQPAANDAAAEAPRHPATNPPGTHQPGPHLVDAAASAPAAPPAKKRGVKRFILLGLALAAAAYAGHAGYQWWTVGRFMATTDDAYVHADITILTAKASGYLVGFEPADNAEVAAGDVVARIDDGDYRLALELARARVETQRGTVARVEKQLIAANAAVAEAKAQLDAAQAERVRAEADFDRQQRLARSDFASRSAVDESRAARDRAIASVASGNAAVAQAEANVGVVDAQGEEARRLVHELETQVAKAERDLSFTVVRAPVAGVVGNRAVEKGGWVEPGKRLAALVPLTTVHIEANLKETQLSQVRAGQLAHVRVDAKPDDQFVGRVISVAPAAGSVFSLLPPENATGNFTKVVQRVPVWISVPPEVAERRWLRPGMSVEVSVDTRRPSGDGEEAGTR